MKLIYHCGKYDYETVMSAMCKTRITHENQMVVLRYLVEGVRLKDLGVSKQRAHTRIKQIVEIIECQ